MNKQFVNFLSKLAKIFFFNKLLVGSLSFVFLFFFYCSLLMAVKESLSQNIDIYTNPTPTARHLLISQVEMRTSGKQEKLSYEAEDVGSLFDMLASNSEESSISKDFSHKVFRKRLADLLPESKKLYLVKAEKLLIHPNEWIRKKAPGILNILLDGQQDSTFREVFQRVYPLLGHEDEKIRKDAYDYICSQLKDSNIWKPLLPALLHDNNENVIKFGRLLVHRYWAIAGPESKRLMFEISGNSPICKEALPWNVSFENMESLRSEFAIALRERQDIQLAYDQLLRDRYPKFSWPKSIDLEDLPRIYGQSLSLANFLLLDLERDLRDYEDNLIIATLLQNLQVITPSWETVAQLKEWFNKGRNGCTLTIFAVACPDYSYKRMFGVNRFTFESLGEGIGLVAKRFLEILPGITNFFKSHNINVIVKIALADTEVLSDSNLKRLGLSDTEFLDKVTNSGEAIRKATQSFPVEVIMLSSLCGGLECWKVNFEKYRTMLDLEDFGGLALTPDIIDDVLKVRKPLYERWFGQYDEDFALRCLKAQAAEYACVGAFVGMTQKDCVIVGVDHLKMYPFYNASNEVRSTPIVYRPPYYE